MTGCQFDLTVLVSDKNMEFAMRGLLSRPRSLGIRPISFVFFVHPQRDPGCLRNGPDFLRTSQNQSAHALLMFDYQGCSRENDPADLLENETNKRLATSGWDDRAAINNPQSGTRNLGLE